MKKVLVVLLVAFIIIQFFPIDRENPPINKGMDFLTIKNTPESTAALIRNGCYDCHSNETKYPWYTNIQPVAWFLKSHIDEGRKKRSEEHTSELQSRENLVCRLLLEKKKRK